MRDLPPPLPPAERTVGQLIGETIRAYGEQLLARCCRSGSRSRPSTRLGASRRRSSQVVIFCVAGAVRHRSVRLRLLGRPDRRGRRPTAVLARALDLRCRSPCSARSTCCPRIAWFALVGLARPRLRSSSASPFRAAFVRGRRLGRADFVHALGSLARSCSSSAIAEITLQRLLHSQSDTSARVALLLADVVLSPLLYLGGALLYARPGGEGRLAATRPKERAMPTYILLSTLTQQGVQTLKANPERLLQVNKDIEELGVTRAPPVGDARRVRLRERRRGARHRDDREGLRLARRARLRPHRDAARAGNRRVSENF